MPQIKHEGIVKADPEPVFALISRVEPFVELCEAVRDIEVLGDGHYRWHVRVAGFKLQFEVEVTEIEPPSRFAWQSVTGIPNRGSYTLTPVAEGTHLHLSLEYELGNRLLARVVAGTTRSIVNRVSKEIVGNMEELLAR